MATSTNTTITDKYRESTGITDGNEVFFQLDDRYATVVELINTSAGSATLYSSVDDTTPTAFTTMAPDPDGATSANSSKQLPAGVRWVSADVASGTWTMKVSQIFNDD